ncbi:MFS transporter [Corynebacterium uropygiale]|uniref:MFS transporter n=1 Tax=Corynebacterium uropygiale TaxID=1775911 RepID=A0A9X1U7I4_9CORY|nr:MFS transporter [Corynebacterium uropygiale]MCF4006787.1 MFS transporter [Corynebacterium uropygiale]
MAFLAVFTAALNLRAGIASLGPVLADMLGALGASGTWAGVLTAMPGMFFAIMGVLAVPIAMRVGVSRTLTAGMVLTLAGLALRPFVGSIALFLPLTALVVSGIALSNVLLPAWIKAHGGRHVVILMTIYGAVLGLSGALGPLSALVAQWQGALLVWALPAVVQLLVWIVVLRHAGVDIPDHGAGSGDVQSAADSASGSAAAGASSNAKASLWSSPTAVFLMIFFGLQSMTAYTQMGWMPQMLTDAGVSSHTASIAIALVGAMNVIGGLVMPTIIDRARSLAPFPVAFGVLTVLGYLGILLGASAAPLLWAFLLGIGGFCFPTALALIPARSRSPLVTARLSGFVQPVGYVIAAVGPFLVGVAYQYAGEWTGILWALIVCAVLMGLVGLRASRSVFIDDELGAVPYAGSGD